MARTRAHGVADLDARRTPRPQRPSRQARHFARFRVGCCPISTVSRAPILPPQLVSIFVADHHGTRSVEPAHPKGLGHPRHHLQTTPPAHPRGAVALRSSPSNGLPTSQSTLRSMTSCWKELGSRAPVVDRQAPPRPTLFHRSLAGSRWDLWSGGAAHGGPASLAPRASPGQLQRRPLYEHS